jgi:hypothetical protein
VWSMTHWKEARGRSGLTDRGQGRGGGVRGSGHRTRGGVAGAGGSGAGPAAPKCGFPSCDDAGLEVVVAELHASLAAGGAGGFPREGLALATGAERRPRSTRGRS